MTHAKPFDTTLRGKQQRFVDEYLIDLNAKQAAIRAGYSLKRAEITGSELLANRKVSEGIALAMRAREERTHITQDRVLQQLARIVFFDIRKLYRADGSMKAMHELDDDAAAVLSSLDVVEMAGGMSVGENEGVAHVPMYTKKMRIPDKIGALSLAMRHLGMLVDRSEVTGRNGQPLIPPSPDPSEEALNAARDRQIQRLQGISVPAPVP